MEVIDYFRILKSFIIFFHEQCSKAKREGARRNPDWFQLSRLRKFPYGLIRFASS